jgi:hypothetical protein
VKTGGAHGHKVMSLDLSKDSKQVTKFQTILSFSPKRFLLEIFCFSNLHVDLWQSHCSMKACVVYSTPQKEEIQFVREGDEIHNDYCYKRGKWERMIFFFSLQTFQVNDVEYIWAFELILKSIILRVLLME